MSAFVFNSTHWKTFDDAQTLEWSVQNGAGGYAANSLLMAPTRRHHGLLVASLTAPVQRQMIWTRCEELLCPQGGTAVRLDGAAWENNTVIDTTPLLQGFRWDGLPHWAYITQEVEIRRTITMQRESNTTALAYRVKTADKPVRLVLTPRFCWRGAGDLPTEESLRFRPALRRIERRKDQEVLLYPAAAPQYRLRLRCNMGEPELMEGPNLSAPLSLRIENETGSPQPTQDAAFFCFILDLAPNTVNQISLVCALEDAEGEFGKLPSAQRLCNAELRRLDQILDNADAKDPTTAALVRAADQFLVKRQSTDGMTMLAGLPWFTDWGRDTMIAFEGNCLCTRRFAEARSILETFSRYEKDGLVPNMFPDEGGEPLYNTADASLWFVCAVELYLQYTGAAEDYSFVYHTLWECVRSILLNYEVGTDYSIGMDPTDGLLRAGSGLDQVTWMDVRVGNWVPTPRHGKPVELNALWYTALCIGQRLAHRFGDEENQAHWKALSHHVLHNFASAFWNETGGYLCDCIRPDGTQDKTLRPNQLLAVSLRRCLPQETPPLLNPWQERNLVMVCERRLRAGAGMRTLPPDHPDYHGQYIGALAERDAAYHQGTAWGWLTGEFLIAHSYAFGDSEAERLALRRLIHPVLESMRTGGINGIAEIFDGDDPYTSRGCFNQAWSVGTVLAAWRRLPGLEKGAVKRSKLD